MNTRSKSSEDRFYNWQITPQVNDKPNSFTYRSAIDHLRKNYLNTKSGVSFGGVNRIYNFYNKLVSLKEIQKIQIKIILTLYSHDLLKTF